MGTTSTSNTPSTAPEKTTISHLEQLPTQALASLPTHPLISVAAAAYVLALIYLPRHLLSLLLSPVSLTCLLLLAALLHLGSSSGGRPQQEEKQKLIPPCAAAPAAVTRTPPSAPTSQQEPVFSWENHRFVDWAWQRGPLEVIYEEYEGEAEEEDMDEDSPGCPASPGRPRRLGLQGVGSLGLRCYADDSDEDSESDSPAWDSQERFCCRWQVEDAGLIEIALEDNLIEIDISACR